MTHYFYSQRAIGPLYIHQMSVTVCCTCTAAPCPATLLRSLSIQCLTSCQLCAIFITGPPPLLFRHIGVCEVTPVHFVNLGTSKTNSPCNYFMQLFLQIVDTRMNVVSQFSGPFFKWKSQREKCHWVCLR